MPDAVQCDSIRFAGRSSRFFCELTRVKLSAPQVVFAVCLGLAGCLFIWVAAPYNNFLLKNSFISDTYLPVAAVVFTLALVLGLNPLLYLVRRGWVLNYRQLALVFAMLLVAATVPSQGLMRMLPWSIARSAQTINQSPSLADAFLKSGVRPELLPDEIGYDLDTPVSDQFLDELDPDQAIPWDAWLSVGSRWFVFLMACWLMMIGVGLVMFPEWKDKERLRFPLLEVYRSLLPEPRSGYLLPEVFKQKLFWAGAGAVMLIYACNGLNHHTRGAFPGFPIGWQLSPVLNEQPWRSLSWAIKDVNHIYFVLVGMAFFMTGRVSFSIWSITVGWYLYEMIQRAYFVPVQGGTIHDYRNGAFIAVTLLVLYISWRHWWHVGHVMVHRVASDGDRLLRMSGWMIAVGSLVMFFWLNWAGVPYIWSVVFVVIGFMVSVLIARIVAETGLPFIRVTGLNAGYFMTMLPAGWLTGGAIYMAGFLSLIFSIGSRMSVAVMATHAVGLDENASARHQLRLGYLMIAVLAVGFVVAGAVHLHMGYTHGVTIDGQYEPLNLWGSHRLAGQQNALVNWDQGSWINPSSRLNNLIVGIVIAAGLQIACMYSARWPIHPIGLLVVGHYFGHTAWASIFIGWCLKTFITYCGGAKAFRTARPLFLGLILGEIFSAIIWTAVPIILLLLGWDPGDVGHIPLLPR